MGKPITGLQSDLIRHAVGEDEWQNALQALMTESVDDMDLFQEFLAELERADGDLSRIVGVTHQAVDMHTFVHDKYFLGLDDSIYPKVEEAVKDVIDGGFIQFLAMGAIGRGKTTAAQIVSARHLYELSLEKYPQARFGLMPTSSIVLAMLNRTADLAKDVTFGEFFTMLEPCGYFQEHFPFDTGVKSRMEFPNRIRVEYAAAHSNKLLGKNVIGGITDEMNFMSRIEKSKLSVTGGEFNQAKAIHTALVRRKKSRFLKLGKLPGCICVVSSAGYPGDFTEELKEKCIAERDTQNDKGGLTYIWDGPQWDVVPASRYSGKRFKLEIGDERHGSKILLPTEKPRLGARVLDVPIEHKKDFEEDMDGSLRDLAGINIASERPYFYNRERVWAMADRFTAGGYLSPLTEDVIDLSHGMPDINEEWETIPFPQRHRAMHIDLATSGDYCGIAMGYVYKVEAMRARLKAGAGKVTPVNTVEEVPFVRFDLLLGVKAPVNGEIEFSEVREFVYWVRDVLGYPLKYVTFDGFQSVDSRQILRKAGFVTELISVEGVEAYEALRTAVWQERVEAPENKRAFNELIKLEENRKKLKIDHPQNGSKDIADGMAGVYKELSSRRESWVPAPLQGPQPVRDQRGNIVGATPMPATQRRNIQRRNVTRA